MLKQTEMDRRGHLIFIALLLQVAGLFASRALLSAGMAGMLILCLAHRGWKEQFAAFLHTPLLWGMALLLFIPLTTGIWSEDSGQWLSILRIKLPLLLLPLAFAGPIRLSPLRWEWLALFFLACTLAGTGWSLWHYLQDTGAAHQGYLQAKTLLTPLENDHVRFSWLVTVAIFTAGWLLRRHWSNKRWRPVLILAMAWLVAYAHLLAARTGLLTLYLSVPVMAAWLLFKKRKGGWALVLLAGMLLLPVSAYYLAPTFRNRITYMLYDKGYFEKAHYLPGGNDAIRVISLKAGWNLMKEHPLTGTGFGDLDTCVKSWYRHHYPLMQERDRILPASEWLVYGAAAGWPGFILFAFVMLIPFFTPVPHQLPWWLVNATAACSLLFDIGLEVQFGVFAHAFCVLWWWRWLNDEKEASL